MSEKILSVFIDESGDFGPYEIHAPYYLVSMNKRFLSSTKSFEYTDSRLISGPVWIA